MTKIWLKLKENMPYLYFSWKNNIAQTFIKTKNKRQKASGQIEILLCTFEMPFWLESLRLWFYCSPESRYYVAIWRDPARKFSMSRDTAPHHKLNYTAVQRLQTLKTNYSHRAIHTDTHTHTIAPPSALFPWAPFPPIKGKSPTINLWNCTFLLFLIWGAFHNQYNK